MRCRPGLGWNREKLIERMDNVTVSLQSFLNTDLETLALRAGRILLILIAAIIVAWIVRKLIKRSVGKFADRREARLRSEESPSDEQCGPWRERIGEVFPKWQRQERAAQRARALGSTLSSLATIIIYVVAVMLVLGELNVNLGPILAGAGVAGIALGFGAQKLVRDFLAGIFIVFEDQYGVGDVVDVGEATGVI
jgi:small-conductance mechanosensitive channel